MSNRYRLVDKKMKDDGKEYMKIGGHYFEIDTVPKLTDDEQYIFYTLGEVWNRFLLIGADHPDDVNDFRKIVHDGQRIVLALAMRRMMKQRNIPAPVPETPRPIDQHEAALAFNRQLTK